MLESGLWEQPPLVCSEIIDTAAPVSISIATSKMKQLTITTKQRHQREGGQQLGMKEGVRIIGLGLIFYKYEAVLHQLSRPAMQCAWVVSLSDLLYRVHKNSLKKDKLLY